MITTLTHSDTGTPSLVNVPDDLEMDILMGDLVTGLIASGKSYDWIYNRISTGIEIAIQEHKDANGVES